MRGSAVTSPAPKSTLEELCELEPIFHTPGFDPERMLAPDYWEVGASGTIYTRSFILDQLLPGRPYVDARSAGWRVEDFALRELAPQTFLATYTLHQGARVSRRATVWRRAPEGWLILYHQGTLVP